MLLLPILSPFAGESTVSWCSRLAGFHTGLSCSDWLKMMQISRQSVVETNEPCVSRLSSMNGIPADRVRECGVQSAGNRLFRHREEVFCAGFFLRTQTTYCPACLLEDADPAGPSAGRRVGKLMWGLAPVRTCSEHGVALVRRANSGFHEQFQDMNLVAPSDAELEQQVKKTAECHQSPLQAYVERRFAGAAQSDWLDGQKIDQAARACEILGACRLFGAHTDLDTLCHTEWDEAGAAGFEAACEGPTGIRNALIEIAEESLKVKGAGGPQAAFGRLYQWLQFAKSQKDRGPIRDVVREHILDTIAMEPGASLFGTVVTTRRRHSIPSLAKATGLHHKTLRHALVGAGLIPRGEEPNKGSSFEAQAGERLATRIQNSLPVTKIPSYLNCNRTQAEMLVRNGVINQLVPGKGKRGGLLSQVAIEELEEFLKRFRAMGNAVDQVSNGMVDVIAASEIARETVTDIVRLVLTGDLSRVEVVEPEFRFRSVFVDPEEVKALSEQKAAEIGLSAQEVGKRLEVFSSGVSWLRKTMDRDGRPFLVAMETTNARGTVRYRFAETEVERFEQAHSSLTNLAKEFGRSSKALMQQFKEAGVEPIMRRELLNAAIFRRADL